MSASLAFSINGLPVSNVKTLFDDYNDAYPQMWWGLCNSVTLRRGRRASEAHLLLDQAAITSLGNTANTIRITTDLTTVDLKGFYLYECEPVTLSNNGTQLWYAYLKDRRQIGELHTWPAGATSSVQAIGGIPWSTWLSTLWGQLPPVCKGASLSVPALEAGTVSNCDMARFDGISTWHAVCQSLEACGHIPFFNPVTDSYRFLNAYTTQPGLAAAISSNSGRVLWEYTAPSVVCTNIPDKVALVFPDIRHSYIVQNDGYNPPAVRTISTGVAGTAAGTTLGVVDTMRAVYDTDGVLSNTSLLDSRVSDFQRTVLGKARAAANKRVTAFSGFVDILPGEEITEVCWKVDRLNKATTEVRVDGELEFDTPSPLNPVPGCPHRLFQYELSSGWTDGSANAIVKHPDGYESLLNTVVLYDKLSMFTDQQAGDTGWCIMADGRFYAVNAPC